MKKAVFSIFSVLLLLRVFSSQETQAQKVLDTHFLGPSYIVESVAFSPDGKTLASGCGDGTIWLWDAKTGAYLDVWQRSSDAVHSVAFSPNGKLLASGCGDGTIDLWDVKTGDIQRSLSRRESDVFSVAFSPDGQVIAGGCRDGTIDLWDVKTGDIQQILTGQHVYPVRSVAFSPDGKMLASTSSSRTDFTYSYGRTLSWDPKTGVLLNTYGGSSLGVAFWSDGKVLVLATLRGPYDATTGERLDAWPLAWPLGGSNITTSGGGSSLAFSPDGKTMVVRESYRRIGVFTDDIAHALTPEWGVGSFLSFAFSPDGKTLAIGGGGNRRNGKIHLFDANTGEFQQSIEGHTRTIEQLVFSPDGKKLISSGGVNDWTIRVWDAQTGAHLKLLYPFAGGYKLALSPDGQRLASLWRRSQSINVFDANTGEPLYELWGHGGDVRSIAFAPAGQTLASASRDETIRFWDAQTGAHTNTLAGHTSSVESLAFSPDGQTLVSGDADGTIRLWNATTGARLGTLTEETAGFHNLVYSPDGQVLASARDDDTIQLLNPTTGEDKNTLSGHEGHIYSIAFSPDSKVLASASADATIGVWDVETGTRLQTLQQGGSVFQSIAFSPDGKTLASGTYGSIALWALPEILKQIQRGPEDVNSDGIVNILDLVFVASRFGQIAAEEDMPADVNGDGIVNILDLVRVAGAFDVGGAAPSLHPQARTHLTAGNVQQWLLEAAQLPLTDPISQRGIRTLYALLTALTPKETALLANYPNPFNPETWIPYQLTISADVTLTIHDIQGRVVRTLDLGHQRAGTYHTQNRAAYWDGKNTVGEPVASGVYFYTLTAGEFTATRKLLIRK